MGATDMARGAKKHQGWPQEGPDSHDGLIVHRNMAMFFSGGSRQELKLRVTGRIWKEE
ncbi:hypothetical protein HPP92_014708 [Vanilla planifolia]|uniref:Uncharacterized protein n=1 Tax=Vanilla planifolia TaxID=51239 RepID=A0A835QGJ0_VANPL|nr:hypothetical protein HPP92_014708 [Vanilla planifolia]